MAAAMSRTCMRIFSTFSTLRSRPGYPPSIRYREDILPRVPKVLGDSEPQYPPIKPSPTARGEEGKKARRDEWIESVKCSETPNEMIYLLQKKQNWHHVVHSQAFQQGYAPLFRDITKTEVVDEMPENIKLLSESDQVKTEVGVLSDHMKDILTTDLYSAERMEKIAPRKEGERAQSLGQTLVRVLVSYLGLKCDHLNDAAIDERHPLESFWGRGERRLQFTGEPVSSVRTKEPLSQFVDTSDDLCQQEIEKWQYDPKEVGIYQKHLNSVCFPGFKYRPDHLNPHTQVYGLSFDKEMAVEKDMYQEMHENFGLISGFAWINALAMYQHHCQFMDIPRPMTAQVIFTDGSLFSFYCYQANTIDLAEDTSPLNNVCFQRVMVPMFTDIKDGVVRDFNEDALRLLLAFFMNPTVKPS